MASVVYELLRCPRDSVDVHFVISAPLTSNVDQAAATGGSNGDRRRPIGQPNWRVLLDLMHRQFAVLEFHTKELVEEATMSHDHHITLRKTP